MPRIQENTKKRFIAESPLLNNVESDETEEVPTYRSSRSTINPDKFEKAKFSEMKEQDESPFRIIIYIIVVIVIGVVAALGVRYFLLKSNDKTEDDTTETDNTDTVSTQDTPVTVNVVAALDSQATSKSTLTDYVDSELVTLGDTTANTSLISKLAYQRYTTFGRLTFTSDSTSSFPKTSVKFDTAGKKITVTFAQTTPISADLQKTISINDLVTNVVFNSNDHSFTITLANQSKYSVQTLNNQLLIDVKTLDQIAIDQNASTTADDTTTTTPPATTDDTTTDTTTNNAPTTVTTSNNFSQTKQYIVSNVTANSVPQDKFYYEDANTYFEFAFGSEDHAGDQYIPNASAELITASGKFYIEIVIKNLSTEAFSQYGITGTGLTESSVNLDGANFVRIDRVSFENGTATYRMEIKNKADFRIIAIPTVDGKTEVIAIQVKD